MARGKHRPNGAGRVDRNAFAMGREAFQKGKLPLPPEGASEGELNDFYEGYEMYQTGNAYPDLGRWGRGN